MEENRKKLTIFHVSIPPDNPIEGCVLTPLVLTRIPSGMIVNADHIRESAPVAGHFLRYRWYRVESDKDVAFCSIHPFREATKQCDGCAQAKQPIVKSYHCTSKCLSEASEYHRYLHEIGASAVNESGCLVNVSAAVTRRSGVKTLIEVGQSKTYTPTVDDVNHVLKFECVVVDAETKIPVGHVHTAQTSRVILAPFPFPRFLIPVCGMADRDAGACVTSSGTFTVLSYNILSDERASSGLFNYCRPLALSWPYRSQNLLREIVGYGADIICLQEVQNNHYEDFFAPKLHQHGYNGVYKRNTNEEIGNNINKVDGCATFFRRDKFSLLKITKVEYNECARNYIAQADMPTDQKEAILNRLIKDNVAVMVTLETKFDNKQVDNPEERQILRVANTRVNMHRDFDDVKLFQVASFLENVDDVPESGVPTVICGDFDSFPLSAPHTLLTSGNVGRTHPEFAVNPPSVLRGYEQFVHEFSLVSAYSSFVLDREFEQLRRVHVTTKEPLFTRFTRNFLGTVDYIFYTADSLEVESLLQLLSDNVLRRYIALPSPEWSSDHIALLAEFRFSKNRSRA